MLEYDARKWHAHLFDIEGSMLREIFPRAFVVTLWSAVVVAFDFYVRNVEVSTILHTLLGLALSLLLVFRTNASYDRFWEGRRLWGSIVNTSRNLGRGSRVHLSSVPKLHERVIILTVAFSDSLRESLRGVANIGPIRDRLDASEVRELLATRHVPLSIALRISETLNEARRLGVVSDFIFLDLDRNVRELIDHMGACERIRKTPLPFVYVVHIRRALILYCATLPFVLAGILGWMTIPCTFLLAYFLFGIEEIGVEIEDPFGLDVHDLPIEKICSTIEGNLLGMIDFETHPLDGRDPISLSPDPPRQASTMTTDGEVSSPAGTA